ncbi:hypothetical protein EEL32_12160 [Brevibacillus laterosporus]|nr:hypothetical protein [Brevibacillus laterosporus]TPG86859.1 hypothetical protein EEL32_12160 [Brevibacillus laterosporus]
MESTLKIKAWATGGPYGVGVYEIHDSVGGSLGLLDVQKLKDKGLVRRIDHSKKAEDYLNTDEGRAFFLANRRFG